MTSVSVQLAQGIQFEVKSWSRNSTLEDIEMKSINYKIVSSRQLSVDTLRGPKSLMKIQPIWKLSRDGHCPQRISNYRMPYMIQL